MNNVSYGRRNRTVFEISAKRAVHKIGSHIEVAIVVSGTASEAYFVYIKCFILVRKHNTIEIHISVHVVG